MTLSNSVDGYGSVAKVFHWLVALLILTAIPTGLVANGLPVDAENLPVKATLFSIHKTLGVTAFFVAILRIIWAIGQPKPALLNSEKPIESFAAETAHWLLYASLVIVPLSGWIHHAATEGFAPILWPLGQSLPLVPKSEPVASFFAAWHFVFTKVLGVTVLLHIVGALKHHVIDKDATLRRMWFGKLPVSGLVPHASARAPIMAATIVYLAAIGLASALALSSRGHDIGAETLPSTQSARPLAGNWAVESGTLGISVKQLSSDVAGSFATWQAEIAFDENATTEVKGDVFVTIDIGSLTLGSVTSNALGPDFFDAANFPSATYGGDIVATVDGYQVNGLLNLKDVEAEVPLEFSLEIDGDTATMNGTADIDRRTFSIGDTYPDESSVGFPVAVSVSLVATRK